MRQRKSRGSKSAVPTWRATGYNVSLPHRDTANKASFAIRRFGLVSFDDRVPFKNIQVQVIEERWGAPFPRFQNIAKRRAIFLHIARMASTEVVRPVSESVRNAHSQKGTA